MKNKFSIWLNIVIICICMCAITIGVYSASNASLTASGNVGFKSHKAGVVVKKFDDAYVASEKTALGEASCCPGGVPAYGSQNGETTYQYYVERFPYYIEMGAKGGVAIKWLIVGVDNGGAIAALAQEDKDAFAQGVMLDKEYYVLSEKTLENTAFDDGSNEYVTSDIRKYLIGGFITTYAFTQDDLNKIQARSVKEMYETDNISVDQANEKPLQGGQTFPSGIDDASDYFWLLSQTEIQTIFAEDTAVCTRDKYKVFLSGRTTKWVKSEADDWWLRSPYNNIANARYVCGKGYSSFNGTYYTCGVRVAFKI